MGLNVPNLDDGCTAEELDDMAVIFQKLQHYCVVRAEAKRCRLAGNIAHALSHEQVCDRIYKTLPPTVRW